jgi:hypothetical protein
MRVLKKARDELFNKIQRSVDENDELSKVIQELKEAAIENVLYCLFYDS